MSQSKQSPPPSCTTEEQKNLRERELDESFFLSNSVSARDCTGTVVRGPQSDGVAKAYDEVYHYKPQVPDALKRK